jgi:peptide/nickel transport system permease protein
MLIYFLRRGLFFGLTLIFSSLLIFFLLRVLPGDVARIVAGGREASPERVAAVRQELGLDAPLPMQYLQWAGGFVRGDWGESTALRGEDNFDLVRERLNNSARLALVALLMAVPLSLGLGIMAGLYAGRWPDTLISVLSLSVVSLPEFITGLFLVNTVAIKWQNNPIAERLGWFPATAAGLREDASFAEALPTLWLPAIAATFVLLAYLIRLTRAGVIEELKQDYVRQALLKGLPYRAVIWRHVLRNALLPTVTVIALSFNWLISGLVVIEVIFRYKGLGDLLIRAIQQRDFPLVQAILMVTVGLILLANLAADLLYSLLNPRIELK